MLKDFLYISWSSGFHNVQICFSDLHSKFIWQASSLCWVTHSHQKHTKKRKGRHKRRRQLEKSVVGSFENGW